MYYYYFKALYFDAKHQRVDEITIRVEGESLEEAIMRALKDSVKFMHEYPYKLFNSLELKQITRCESSQGLQGGDD